MKRRFVLSGILIALLIGVIATSGCKPVDTVIRVIDASPSQALDVIQKNKGNRDFVVLDVRTPQEFAEGHLEGAINIDYLSSSFKGEVEKLDKQKTYLVYCRSGNRSKGAVEVMTKLVFTKIYHLSAGIAAWQSAGLPTTK